MGREKKNERERIRFSVVVPAYNDARPLAACLESLTAQVHPGENYEVIVVDDGSTDDTPEVAGRFDVRYIFQPNRGPAAARNRGARAADGAIVLFTDADCVPFENWLAEMVRPFQDSSVCGVKGAYRTRQRQLSARFAQVEFEDRYRLLQSSDTIDMVDTYSAAFRKAVFFQMGGFDERFPVANNEDTDLSYRMATAGCRLVFAPDARVYHTHPETFFKYWKVKFWRGYWRMVVYRNYPQKAIRDSYTPQVIKFQTLAVAASFPLLPIACLAPFGWYALLSLWGGVLVSAVPFSWKAWRKDRLVGILSPAIIFCRSVVFACGSLLGVIRSFHTDAGR